MSGASKQSSFASLSTANGSRRLSWRSSLGDGGIAPKVTSLHCGYLRPLPKARSPRALGATSMCRGFVGVCLAIAWLVLGPTPLAYAEPPENYPFLSYDEGLKQARAQDKRIFLYFGRLGCGWCDKTKKEAFSDPALRTLYINHYVLVYADAESGKRLTLPSGA